MTKRVKLSENDTELGMDEIKGDDNLSLDDVSGDGDTMTSQDASEFEGDPKSAPERLFFGQDRCLKQFQLTNDVANGVI